MVLARWRWGVEYSGPLVRHGAALSGDEARLLLGDPREALAGSEAVDRALDDAWAWDAMMRPTDRPAAARLFPEHVLIAGLVLGSFANAALALLR